MKLNQRMAAPWRWLGVGVLTLGLGTMALPGVALPPEEIDRKLDAVPVFVVTDRAGNPVPVAIGDEEGRRQAVLRGFADPAAAQDFLERVRGADDAGTPEMTLVTSPLSLSGLFAFSRRDGASYRVQLVAADDALTAARAIVERSGRDPATVRGLPLFLLTAGEGSDRTYVIAETDGGDSIRFYMDADMALEAVEAFQAAVPALADTVRIEVIPLDEVLSKLVTRDDTWLTQVEIVPSSDAMAAVSGTGAAADLER